MCFAGIGGVGNFILGNNGIAAGQLILMCGGFVMAYIVCCISGCGALCGEKGMKIAGGISGLLVCITSMALVAGFIWNIVDAAYILQGKILDGNGYDTY